MFRPGDAFIAGDKASESRVVTIAFINLVHGAQRGAWGLGAPHNNRFRLRRQIVDSTLKYSV
jgi:hypothetical protein